MSEDKSQLAKHSVEEVVPELVPASRVGGAGLMVGGVFKLCTKNHLGLAGIILFRAVMLCMKLPKSKPYEHLLAIIVSCHVPVSLSANNHRCREP